jgi:hypothetical protein
MDSVFTAEKFNEDEEILDRRSLMAQKKSNGQQRIFRLEALCVSVS